MPTKDETNRAVTELQAAVKRIDSDIPPVMERLRQTALSSVDEAEQLARQARKSSGEMAAVKPPSKPRGDARVEPGTHPVATDRVDLSSVDADPDSITKKYEALRNFK